MDRTAQTLTLRDGRTLGYAEWGDLNGKPVFFFGGSNSARYFRHLDDTIIAEMGIHLYTFDRPGQGLSTRQPQRRLLDWPEDMRDFVTQKDISRFAIVAASQGGPYGAACAYALPELLSSVSLVSGVAGLENSAPGAIDLMIEDIREGMRQGGAGGADDMRAVVTDWGFRLEDVRTKVFIWQGEDDPNVTPAMARYMAERIPDNETTFVPGAGHFLAYSHWRAVLRQLLDHWRGG